jgi:hypothetical protein
MATVKDALELTTRTIDRRAYHYRNLVVLVVVIVLIFVVWAVIRRSILPLLGLFLLLPLCGGFLFLDAYLVNGWRDRILQMWVEEELNLDAFAKSICAIRLLPAGTLGALLATLPVNDNAPATGKLSTAMKKALALTLTTVNRCECDRTGFGNLAYTVAAATVSAAVIESSWMPLAGVFLVAPVFGLAHLVRAARWRGWHRALVALQREQGLEPANFVEVSAKLDWGSIPAEEKQRLLCSLPLVG